MKKLNPKIIGFVIMIITLLIGGVITHNALADPVEPTVAPCPPDDTGN